MLHPLRTAGFSDLSFHLGRGQMIHLRGANGSGKTSLLRICAGFLPLISGQVAVGGACHYIGHANALTPTMSVGDMLQFWMRLMNGAPGGGREKGIGEESLDQWHLRDLAAAPIAILSAGQARALALCRLRLASRPLWLLDEPDAGLDDVRCDILRQQMSDHLQRGGAIIMAGHSDYAVKIDGDVSCLDMDAF